MVRMRRSVVLTAACLALALIPTGAQAQFVAPDSGVHVRIGRDNESKLQEGSFVSSSADSFSLSPGYGSGVISLPIRSIRTVDVSSGRQASTAIVIRDAAIGGGLGIASAALITAVGCASQQSHQSSDGGIPCVFGFVITAPVLGRAGALVGGWIGAEHPVENWTRVYDRDTTTGLLIGPTWRGGLEIGMSVAFGGPDRSP